MGTIPLRLDWLRFLGLSKARARWGVKAFQSFFERIARLAQALINVTYLYLPAAKTIPARNGALPKHPLP